MTKQEAIEQMEKGVKITHPYFQPDEWMTMKKGKIFLEDGVKCYPREFWVYRTEGDWNDGYSVFTESN